ncbi:replication family protein, partial [Escherichia coli 7-233-03_S3_C1]
ETLKYSVKPEDMANDPEWFLELTRQLHKRRFISTGGALKTSSSWIEKPMRILSLPTM